MEELDKFLEKYNIPKLNQEKIEKLQQKTQIIRDYYQQLYVNKMDNLKETDKFLEKYNFPKLNQEETKNLNKPITSTEIETVIEIFQQTKAQVQMLHS